MYGYTAVCLLLVAFIDGSEETVIMPNFNNSESLYYLLSEPLQQSDDAARAGRPGSATNTHSCNRVRAVPLSLRYASQMGPRGLGQFYQKYTEAYGIPILSSRNVPVKALRRACYIVRFLFADRYDIRNSYYKNHGRVAVMGAREVTTHIPEHAYLGVWWNSRARGLGATISAPVSTAGEENVLCYTSDRYRSEDIALHEFSHGLHLLGAYYVIPHFLRNLINAYNSARYSGKWARTYSLSTKEEYWAEGVQSYFGVNAYANPANGVHGPISTRNKLKSYDPTLFSLIQQAFPCGNTYIKRCGSTRSKEHKQKLRMNCQSGTGSVTGSVTATVSSCKDNHRHCKSWGETGYCLTSQFMQRNCRMSCQTCSDCRDNNTGCARWASRRECTKNPRYMLINCRKSCKQC